MSYPVPPPPQQRGVTKTRRETNHTFHLLMTVLTCSLWAFVVWLPMILWHKLGPKKKVVTRYE